jgi:hypothetical protein
MATIHIDVEGFEPFEFDIKDHMTAGEIGSTIRTACGLFRGSVRRDLRAFGEDRVLEPGVYSFTGFSREGKYSHVSFIPSLFSLTSIIHFYKIDLKHIRSDDFLPFLSKLFVRYAFPTSHE